MNSDFKNEYKDLIKRLNGLDEIRASKNLTNKISLLAKQKSKTKNHWPQLLLTRAAFFAVILALLTGGGIYASEKVDSEKVVDPIKNAAIQFQATLKKKSTTTSKEEANNKRGDDEIQSSKNSTEDGSNNKESDKDSNKSNADNPTPEPTTKPENVLGDVSEGLPEPAKDVVEGVKEALENKPPQSNNNQDRQENSESENNTPGVDIDIENKKNKGSENSSKDIELDINPPFLQEGGE